MYTNVAISISPEKRQIACFQEKEAFAADDFKDIACREHSNVNISCCVNASTSSQRAGNGGIHWSKDSFLVSEIVLQLPHCRIGTLASYCMLRLAEQSFQQPCQLQKRVPDARLPLKIIRRKLSHWKLENMEL